MNLLFSSLNSKFCELKNHISLSDKPSYTQHTHRGGVFNIYLFKQQGFADSSVGKESACNAGDHGLIPRSGISTGGGIGYPLQYSWASVVAQLVKNLPTMWETWVRSLGW